MTAGYVVRVSGPLVVAENVPNPKVGDVVYIGENKLIGEIIRISLNRVFVQVYEDTSGVKPKDPVENTGKPLTAKLGPGILKQIYDGLQNPLTEVWHRYGPFVPRGVKLEPLDTKKRWTFIPALKEGDEVEPVDILGKVPETKVIEHRILAPHGFRRAKIIDIREGKYTIKEPFATLETSDGKRIEVTMVQEWPVKIPRPVREKLPPTKPLITGMRVIDTFFPIAMGGSAAIPGGFGTGKTVTLQNLAKWSWADIIIYVGCGERGNEMADVVTHFPELDDPRTGHKLIERSVFIANVSNLPVAAREASVYLGATIGEYFRDQGYNVAMMADSTSRWMEAVRELGGRLGDVPVEEGFPAYIVQYIAAFYERAGRVVTLGKNPREGSLTIMGAVSPPGGDFIEPVTATTMRFIGVLWTLDKKLAFARHFPSINWALSFSSCVDLLREYFAKEFKAPKFFDHRAKALGILEEGTRIEDISKIVGEKALQNKERFILRFTKMFKDGYLVQNAYDVADRYTPPEIQARILEAFMKYYEIMIRFTEVVPVEEIERLESTKMLVSLKFNWALLDEKAERVIGVNEEAFKRFYEVLHNESKLLAEKYGIQIPLEL
ncbi:MAG: V-type ATP synthase subunit A [Crenarchaeota archaeon]|nr:V-type ATP synthase subunit A [Thermoproteota archaeon]MCR8453881.1 V-type ATP synthase subunit A [Thermoproteota archaeon]MCR8455300.1 V-type ATP synthase subunit A [Thermoproteota archaeon]MCR8500782.1 V-type ATP synthase subunit A [Thermoproteota archaeon]